jgi:hypothetical protein
MFAVLLISHRQTWELKHPASWSCSCCWQQQHCNPLHWPSVRLSTGKGCQHPHPGKRKQKWLIQHPLIGIPVPEVWWVICWSRLMLMLLNILFHGAEIVTSVPEEVSVAGIQWQELSQNSPQNVSSIRCNVIKKGNTNDKTQGVRHNSTIFAFIISHFRLIVITLSSLI